MLPGRRLDQTFAPHTAHAADAIPQVDLAVVSKTADATRAHPNQLVTYTIVATNYGPDTALTLDVYDLVDFQDSGLQLVNESCDQGISADTPACEYSDIAPGHTVTTTVAVRVLRHSGLKVATNQACVLPEDTVNDLNTNSDCLSPSPAEASERRLTVRLALAVQRSGAVAEHGGRPDAPRARPPDLP